MSTTVTARERKRFIDLTSFMFISGRNTEWQFNRKEKKRGGLGKWEREKHRKWVGRGRARPSFGVLLNRVPRYEISGVSNIRLVG